jgi:ABC-type phosphate/phosphonate transport system permease subunit
MEVIFMSDFLLFLSAIVACVVGYFAAKQIGKFLTEEWPTIHK